MARPPEARTEEGARPPSPQSGSLGALKLGMYVVYRDRQFIFGFSFQKVPDSNDTGSNTRAGQQMLVRIKLAGASVPVDDMPHEKFSTMLSEQVLEKKDLGLKVFD